MAQNRPWRSRAGVSTAQLLVVTVGGCCISSVHSGSAEATAPASTLPGEVQMPWSYAQCPAHRSYANLPWVAKKAFHGWSISHEAVSKRQLQLAAAKESCAYASSVEHGRLGLHLR